MAETKDIPFGPGPLRGLKVLVAEDDAWTAEWVSLILEEEGARLIGPCRSVAEARARLKNDAAQFVLVDLALADNFADALVRDAIRLEIPYAIITGYAALPSNVYSDAVGVLRKPLTRRDLIDLLTLFA